MRSTRLQFKTKIRTELNVAIANQWQKRYEQHGITVFTRPVPGSEFDEFRAEGVSAADVGPMVSLLWAVEDMPRWMEGCIHAELKETISPFERKIYIVNTTYGLTEPRDLILHNKIEQNEESGIVNYSMDLVSDNNETSLIHVKKMKGFVELQPLGPQSTKVIYQAHIEAGGYMPKWLINLAIKKLPIITLARGQSIMKMNRYPDFPGIKNYDQL